MRYWLGCLLAGWADWLITGEEDRRMLHALTFCPYDDEPVTDEDRTVVTRKWTKEWRWP